jgi:hypothetical protein
MENKQQTAVEWLVEQIEKGKIEIVYSDKIHSIKCIPEIIQQAKEMEKEQIINTWSEATAPDHEIGLSDAPYIISQVQKAEQYYNKKYGANK